MTVIFLDQDGRAIARPSWSGQRNLILTQSNPQREFALQVVKQLRDAGYEALWAGGCVRDQLLGRTPKDYDVATSARPEQVRNLFGKRRTLAVGAAFGVIAILGGRQRGSIEVATFRSDGAYLDGRHPEEVVYTTAQGDAQRRDFTINGLFFDPLAEEVIDYVHGTQDIQRGLVRAIGDPRQRFSEDKLRMLRAIRFAATFDFQIDDETLTAICEMAQKVAVVSAERIGAELRQMLLCEHRVRAVELLNETELLRHMVSCFGGEKESQDAPIVESRFQRTLMILGRLRSPSLPLALAALLMEVNTRSAGTVVARELRFTKKEGELTEWLLRNVSRVAEAQQAPWPILQKRLIHRGAQDLVALHEAIVGAEDAAAAFCKAKLDLPPLELNPEPLVTGAELISHGIRPGPRFAEILDYVRDEQLRGCLVDQQQALEAVDRWLQENNRK